MDRDTMADVIARAVNASRLATDAAAAQLQLATRSGLLPPHHYRRHVLDAISQLEAVSGDLLDLLDLLTYYALLYPEAHDDAAGEWARPGDCACGRPADSCPARAAGAAGELTWTAEDGQDYALNDPGPQQPQDGPAEAGA